MWSYTCRKSESWIILECFPQVAGYRLGPKACRILIDGGDKIYALLDNTKEIKVPIKIQNKNIDILDYQ